MSEPGLSQYRRLPGQVSVFRRMFNTSSALWLGEDHLLEVETTYFTESYRRFSYGGIQATLLRETSRGLVYSSILGTLAAGSGLLAWSIEDPTSRWVFVGLAGVCALGLIFNLIRGKTCRCQLQTAAGPRALPSLSRLRPARRAWRLIEEKVTAAQGVLAPEEAVRRMDSRTR